MLFVQKYGLRIVYDKSSGDEYIFTGIMYTSSDKVVTSQPLLDIVFWMAIFAVSIAIFYRIYEYKSERIKQE